MSQFGIKVAQKGTDISRAPDYQLVLSTDWPTLKVAGKGAFGPIQPNTGTQVIFQHSLNYYPAFIIYRTDANATPANVAGQSEMSFPGAFFVSNQQLYCDTTLITSPFTGYFYVFKQDLNTVITSPVSYSTIIQSEPAPVEGLKVAKSGKNTNSPHLEDYSVSTDAHEMVIHLQGSQALQNVTGPQATIVHNLGYYPIFLTYNQSTSHGDIGQGVVRATANLNQIQFQGVQAPLTGTLYYLILKDPLFVGD